MSKFLISLFFFAFWHLTINVHDYKDRIFVQQTLENVNKLLNYIGVLKIIRIRKPLPIASRYFKLYFHYSLLYFIL